MKRLFALLGCVALLGCLAAGCDEKAVGATDGITTAPTGGSVAQVADPDGSRQLGSNIMQRMNDLDYPAYYGGCYIGADNSVVIQVTDLEQAKDGLKDVLSRWEEHYYRFEEVSASYRQLLALQEQIGALTDDLAEQNIRVTATHIEKGCVSVGILELDEAKEQTFRQLLDSPLIELWNSPGVSTD